MVDAGSLASTATMRQVHVLIIRHGETEANARGILQGQLDTELNQVSNTAN
jgi:hypothetical protein